MRLSPVEHDLPTHVWCGPAAVSAITGLPTSEVVHSLKRRRRRQKQHERIQGTSYLDLRSVLRQHGFAANLAEYYEAGRGPSFGRWLQRGRPTRHAFVVMLDLPEAAHWIVVNRQRFVDNYHPRPIDVDEAPYRRRRVCGVIHVTRFDGDV